MAPPVSPRILNKYVYDRMSSFPPTDQLLIALFIGLTWLAAISHIRSLRIPNQIVMIIAALYPAYVLAAPYPVDWIWAIAVSAGFLAVGTVLYAYKAFGPGDVKLMTAVSLWAGLDYALGFGLISILVGGALGYLMGFAYKDRAVRMAERLRLGLVRDMLMAPSVPFSTAMAFGAVYVAFMLVRGGLGGDVSP